MEKSGQKTIPRQNWIHAKKSTKNHKDFSLKCTDIPWRIINQMPSGTVIFKVRNINPFQVIVGPRDNESIKQFFIKVYWWLGVKNNIRTYLFSLDNF